MEEQLRSTVDKIHKSLGDVFSVDLNLLGSAMTFSLTPAPKVNSETALQLARAQAGMRQVRLEYYTASRDSQSIRIVHAGESCAVVRQRVFVRALPRSNYRCRLFTGARVHPLGQAAFLRV